MEKRKQEGKINFSIDVLGFNDTSTLVGHFVSRMGEEIEEKVEEIKEIDREERGTGMKMKKQKK